MQTKLTLRLDEALIQRAKAHAHRQGKSVSQMAADHFALLDAEPKTEAPLTPLVESLKGALRGADVSVADCRRHHDETYL